VIKIWELQNDLAAGWPSVPSAHMSGLHAARHAQIRPAAGNLASKRALGICRSSKIEIGKVKSICWARSCYMAAQPHVENNPPAVRYRPLIAIKPQ